MVPVVQALKTHAYSALPRSFMCETVEIEHEEDQNPYRKQKHDQIRVELGMGNNLRGNGYPKIKTDPKGDLKSQRQCQGIREDQPQFQNQTLPFQ